MSSTETRSRHEARRPRNEEQDLAACTVKLRYRKALRAMHAAAAQRFNGDLHAGRTVIGYREGRIVRLATSEPALSLSAYLVNHGAVSRAYLTYVQSTLGRHRNDLGSALIAAGLVSPELFQAHYDAWAIFVLTRLVRRQGVLIVLDPGRPASGPICLPRMAVLTRVARRHLVDVHDGVWPRVDRDRVLTSTIGSDAADALELGIDERRTLERLAHGVTLEQLAEIGLAEGIEPGAAQRVLWLLKEVGALSVGSRRRLSTVRSVTRSRLPTQRCRPAVVATVPSPAAEPISPPPFVASHLGNPACLCHQHRW